jgi:hypothetical protein
MTAMKPQTAPELAELLRDIRPATPEELVEQGQNLAKNYKPGPRQAVPFMPQEDGGGKPATGVQERTLRPRAPLVAGERLLASVPPIIWPEERTPAVLKAHIQSEPVADGGGATFRLKHYEVKPDHWKMRISQFENGYKMSSDAFLEAYKAHELDPGNLDFDEWASLLSHAPKVADGGGLDSPFYANSECATCSVKLYGKKSFTIPTTGTTPGKQIVCEKCADGGGLPPLDFTKEDKDKADSSEYARSPQPIYWTVVLRLLCRERQLASSQEALRQTTDNYNTLLDEVVRLGEALRLASEENERLKAEVLFQNQERHREHSRLRERMQQAAEKLSGVGPNIMQQASLNRFNEALSLLSRGEQPMTGPR